MAEQDAERLVEIKARCEAATPGPWVRREDWSAKVERVYPPGSLLDSIGMAEQSSVFWLQGSNRPNFRADGDFIANAREDVPWLLARLAAAEAERDAAERERQSIANQLSAQLADLATLRQERDAARREAEALRAALENIAASGIATEPQSRTMAAWARGALARPTAAPSEEG